MVAGPSEMKFIWLSVLEAMLIQMMSIRIAERVSQLIRNF